MLLFQFIWTFCQTQNRKSLADWDSLCDHLRDVPLDDVFKLSTSAAASEFCQCAKVGIDVNIPDCKYQVKYHSSLWFSAHFPAVIVHKNHFFLLVPTE